MVAARPDFTKLYVMAADDQQVDVIYQQDWAVNHLTITSSVEKSIKLVSTPVGMFLPMTSIGLCSRDEAGRATCMVQSLSSQCADIQGIGKKR